MFLLDDRLSAAWPYPLVEIEGELSWGVIKFIIRRYLRTLLRVLFRALFTCWIPLTPSALSRFEMRITPSIPRRPPRSARPNVGSTIMRGVHVFPKHLSLSISLYTAHLHPPVLVPAGNSACPCAEFKKKRCFFSWPLWPPNRVELGLKSVPLWGVALEGVSVLWVLSSKLFKMLDRFFEGVSKDVWLFARFRHVLTWVWQILRLCRSRGRSWCRLRSWQWAMTARWRRLRSRRWMMTTRWSRDGCNNDGGSRNSCGSANYHTSTRSRNGIFRTHLAKLLEGSELIRRQIPINGKVIRSLGLRT